MFWGMFGHSSAVLSLLAGELRRRDNPCGPVASCVCVSTSPGKERRKMDRWMLRRLHLTSTAFFRTRAP